MSQAKALLPNLLYSFSSSEVLKGYAFSEHSLKLISAVSECSKICSQERILDAIRKLNESFGGEPSGGIHHLCLLGQCPWTIGLCSLGSWKGCGEQNKSLASLRLSQ